MTWSHPWYLDSLGGESVRLRIGAHLLHVASQTRADRGSRAARLLPWPDGRKLRSVRSGFSFLLFRRSSFPHLEPDSPKESNNMSKSFQALGVSEPVVRALAQPQHHSSVLGPGPCAARRARRPRPARPVADRIGQDARLRDPDRRARVPRASAPRHSSSSPPASSRSRSPPTSNRSRRPKTCASPPSTAARESGRRRRGRGLRTS